MGTRLVGFKPNDQDNTVVDTKHRCQKAVSPAAAAGEATDGTVMGGEGDAVVGGGIADAGTAFRAADEAPRKRVPWRAAPSGRSFRG